MPAVLATVVAALVIGVSGCAGQEPTTNAQSGHPSGHDQSAGGEHGADHGSDHGVTADPPESADWNAADATYLTMMIGHHRQALDMADLAETRASDPGVRAIAASIRTTQGLEIPVMATWLVEHDLPEPTLEEAQGMAGMEGMVGMLSPDQLDELAAADGAEFDRLFIDAMIAHHRGAISMAEDQLATGEDVLVTEMATDVAASQSAEIDRMLQILPATS